jgi:hypothetical protein
MNCCTRFFLAALGMLLLAESASAQISVDLKITRRTAVRHEPILATVTVMNLSGRDLELRDEGSQWFGFQVSAGATENLVPPRDPNYSLDPLLLKAGETVKRTVNLTTLFPMGELVLYRVHATIFSADLNKFFASRPTTVNITEGRTLWRQTVGAPEGVEGGGSRTISMLSYQSPERRYLYARVEDEEAGVVYCTYRLGHMIDGTQPEMQFDTGNNLYVLHLVGPKQYVLSKIGINGQFLGQSQYSAGKSRPSLRRLGDGTLQIVGGRREIAQVTPAGEPIAPVKLSDRPANLPR